MDWKHGYFADNGYTFGYYREMAPCYLAWAALLQGVVTPTRGFRYVDLGCGQGLGLILASLTKSAQTQPTPLARPNPNRCAAGWCA